MTLLTVCWESCHGFEWKWCCCGVLYGGWKETHFPADVPKQKVCASFSPMFFLSFTWLLRLFQHFFSWPCFFFFVFFLFVFFVGRLFLAPQVLPTSIITIFIGNKRGKRNWKIEEKKRYEEKNNKIYVPQTVKEFQTIHCIMKMTCQELLYFYSHRLVILQAENYRERDEVSLVIFLRIEEIIMQETEIAL